MSSRLAEIRARAAEGMADVDAEYLLQLLDERTRERDHARASRDMRDKAWALVHEAAGIRPDGVAGMLGWIDEHRGAYAAGVAAERERCAALCEGFVARDHRLHPLMRDVRDAIRNGGEK